MRKTIVCLILLTISLLAVTACGGAEGELGYEQITAEEAKAIMDTETDYIIIDARTEEEFAEGHIEDAILIPEYEIAAEELVKLGYTDVREFGGIIDWPYETVK